MGPLSYCTRVRTLMTSACVWLLSPTSRTLFLTNSGALTVAPTYVMFCTNTCQRSVIIDFGLTYFSTCIFINTEHVSVKWRVTKTFTRYYAEQTNPSPTFPYFNSSLTASSLLLLLDGANLSYSFSFRYNKETGLWHTSPQPLWSAISLFLTNLSVNLICRNAAIWLRCVVLYVRCTTVSSASVLTS